MLLSMQPTISRTKVNVKSYENINLLGSCSLNFQNRILFFGSGRYSRGQDTQRQIAEIIDCQVKKIGSLVFPFSYGLCTTNSKEIFLCYDGSHRNMEGCKKAKSPTSKFYDTGPSKTDHQQGSLASSSGK